MIKVTLCKLIRGGYMFQRTAFLKRDIEMPFIPHAKDRISFTDNEFSEEVKYTEYNIDDEILVRLTETDNERIEAFDTLKQYYLDNKWYI